MKKTSFVLCLFCLWHLLVFCCCCFLVDDWGVYRSKRFNNLQWPCIFYCSSNFFERTNATQTIGRPFHFSLRSVLQHSVSVSLCMWYTRLLLSMISACLAPHQRLIEFIALKFLESKKKNGFTQEKCAAIFSACGWNNNNNLFLHVIYSSTHLEYIQMVFLFFNFFNFIMFDMNMEYWENRKERKKNTDRMHAWEMALCSANGTITYRTTFLTSTLSSFHFIRWHSPCVCVAACNTISSKTFLWLEFDHEFTFAFENIRVHRCHFVFAFISYVGENIKYQFCVGFRS